MDKVVTHYAKTTRKAVYNVSMPDLVKVVFDIPINDSFDYISDNKKVEGLNMMGKLLMELREEMFGIKSEFVRIKPSNIKRILNNNKNK